MSNAKIIEIFQSVQGEGLYAGVRQVFVRFFECNMHCVWCDTPNSIGDGPGTYKDMTIDEVLGQITLLNKNCHSVSLTGGEPLLQSEFIKNLIPEIKKMGVQTYLDTNGTLPDQFAELVDQIDIIAMDIKLPSSTQQRPFWKEHERILKMALGKDLFIKIIISSQTSAEDITHAAHLIESVDRKIPVIIQPNYFEMGNGCIDKCLEIQSSVLDRLANVRLIPQTHKMLKVR